MNPASWTTPIGTSAIRRVATTAAIRSTSATTMRTPGLRFYTAARSSRQASLSQTQACTNTLRKALHPVPSARFSTTPVPLTTTRLAPIIRRGFASTTGKTATSASTTASPAASGTVAASAPQKTGFMDKIKQLIKQYGYTGVAVYLGISTLDLAATFIIVKAAGMEKIEKAQDYVLEHYGPYFGYKPKPHSHPHEGSEAVDLDKVDDEQVGAIYNKASGLWSVFVIAYGIHKLLVPLRVVATSMITPPLVKWLVKKGWIKKVAKKGAATSGAGAVGAAATPKP
ncbi:hypothetical protein BG015_003120 [Linnemannia schmuckeri]|uniref:DUF1279 domain-containing protein n=1 Tax=Linnemannia schmuckeri TaxID=64567 RepID=A0A9P5RR90_9FUNG|nr:hypothetical protein BG015_003120 [Linnemannia schmuckeri]